MRGHALEIGRVAPEAPDCGLGRLGAGLALLGQGFHEAIANDYPLPLPQVTATHFVRSLARSSGVIIGFSSCHGPTSIRRGLTLTEPRTTAIGSRRRAGLGSNCRTIQLVRKSGTGRKPIFTRSAASVNGLPAAPGSSWTRADI